MERLRESVDEHPLRGVLCGFHRILPELEDRVEKRINHRRLRRLPREHELALPHQASKRNPSPVEKILEKTSGQFSLAEGRDLGLVGGVLDRIYRSSTRRQNPEGLPGDHLMVAVDLESKRACDWAVGQIGMGRTSLRLVKVYRRFKVL